jgi:ribosomal protein S16/energy-coupling factor transporter ATP-binding protein EcfA2
LALLVAAAWLALSASVWVFWTMTSTSIKRQLERWREGLDRAVDRKLSPYGRQYRQWVMDSKRFMDAKGLATVGTFSPELDEVFVDVGLTSRAPQHVRPDLLGADPADGTLRRSIWSFLDQPTPVVLAVIGAPGSGKTTLLNHVARRTAKTSRERRRTVPVLLQLRDHAKDVAAEPRLSLPDLMRRAVPVLPVAEPAGWWESRLQRGKCVVLLDGLDEIANVNERHDIVRWVNTQIAVYPRNDFVVTSRPHGYREAFIDSAATLQVLSFTLSQVRRFLHGWYLAVERRATGVDGREVELLAAEAADDLLDRLAASPALYDLTINPLLLTMIANVHRFRRSLPGSRADLYGEVCQVMLWRRQEAKRLDLDVPGLSKERLLAWLAYQMMRDGTRDITRRRLLDSIRPGLRRLSTDVTAEDFVADVGSNGLLVERERDLYEFAHLTFQEYLAARYIQDHHLGEVLVAAVDNPWWRETTLLYLAGADADPIVQAGLKKGTTTALSLAFECAEVGAELAPDLRGHLRRVLTNAYNEDATPENRRLVAGVLASRHLSRLAPTPVGTRVCPDPVVCSLYWLFLKDTGTPPPDGPCPADPNDVKPVTGVWGSDAARFVDWVNAIVSSTNHGPHRSAGILYRLPTTRELNDLAKSRGPAAQILGSSATRVWTKNGSYRTPATWTMPGNAPSHRVPVHHLLAGSLADLRSSSVLTIMLSRTAAAAARDLSRTAAAIQHRSETLAYILGNARAGVHAGDQDRNMQSAQNITRELNADLKTAESLAATLDRSLRNLSILDHDLARAIDDALRRYPIARASKDLTKASSLERDVAIVLEWNRDLGLETANDHARAIKAAVDRAQQKIRRILEDSPHPVAALSVLDKALGFDINPTPHANGDSNSVLHDVASDLTGIALTEARSSVLRPATATAVESNERFARALVALAIPKGDEISVNLDRVANHVRHLPTVSLQTFAAPTWAHVVLRRLTAAATPILLREHRLSAGHAAAIRLPALALAADAHHASRHELAGQFRELAAAISLMEMRAQDPQLLETIILAYA